MDMLILLIKGFMIGIAFTIPGLSGGTMAIYLGVYHPLLHAIGSFTKDLKKNLKFVLPLLIGAFLAIVSMAKLIGWLLDIDSFATLFFFIGLMIGGLPSLFSELSLKAVKPIGYIAFVLAFLLVIALFLINLFFGKDPASGFAMTFGNVLLVMALGAAAAITMIIPGISGSALLVTLGFYTAIVTNVIGNLFDFSLFTYNLFVAGSFAIGALLGIIAVSKLLDYLLTKHKNESMMGILGFLFASVIVIFLEIRNPGTGTQFDTQIPIYRDFGAYFSEYWIHLLLGAITFVGGFFASKWFAAFGKRADRVGN